MKLLNRIFKLKDEKSKTVVRNTFFSFFIKGLNILVNFLTIPLVLSFLNTTQYGVWLTLTAILGWFSLFDLGFGNGLRNHLTSSIASRNFTEAKIYVSTTYAALGVIFGVLLIIFLLVNPFVNWVEIFNAPISLQSELQQAVAYAISLLFVQFVLRLITTVLLSFQRSAMADLINAIVQTCTLIGLYFLKRANLHSLTAVAVIYSVIPVAVMFFASLALFTKTYSNIKPSFSFVKLNHVKGLLNIGLSFFVIQIASLVLYASDNFIIAQFFSPTNVTTYNIAFKYFSITNIFFTIALAPFWSMTTQAHVEGDLAWVRKAVNRLLVLWIVLAICGVVQLIVSGVLYKFWTHSTVFVPFSLSVIMCVYFFIMNWGVIFGNFLNGVGKIRVQLYFSVVGMIVNVPLAILFIKVFHISIIAVPLATIITMISGNIIASIQYKKIVRKTANGIWNK